MNGNRQRLLGLGVCLVLVACDRGGAETNTPSIPEGAQEQAAVVQGAVTQHGLYRLVRSGGLVDSSVTSTGKAVSKPVIQLVKRTDRIPLIKGAQMYFQYRLWYLPEQPAHVPLRRVLKHPPMRLPDGSVATGSDFMIRRKVSAGQVIAYAGYGFDEDYELVEGDWTFEIWHEDRKLVSKTFTTYRPEAQEAAALAAGLKPTPFPDQPWSRFRWPSVETGVVTYPDRGPSAAR